MSRNWSGTKIWLLVAITAIATLLLSVHSAHACENAVFSLDSSVSTLHDAELALDQGDVDTARNDALTVANAERDTGLHKRAMRLYALSFIRDPKAQPKEIDNAVLLLANALWITDALTDPTLVADYGEALERAHRDEEALVQLKPLAERDLMGSGYAYGALSRAAGRQGDNDLAGRSFATCMRIADSRVCNGAYPNRPLLRGTMLGYLLPGFAFLLAVLMRFWRTRRQTQKPAPWTSHDPMFFATFITLTGVLIFSGAYAAWFTAIVSVLAIVIVSVWQRRAFLRAARKGNVIGFHVRPTEPVGDANAPALRLLFASKTTPDTLERIIHPTYRESPRAPVYRLVRRPPGPIQLAVMLLVAFLLLCMAAMTVFTLRGAPRHASTPTVPAQDFSPQE